MEENGKMDLRAETGQRKMDREMDREISRSPVSIQK
jgi:hypothetical protein